MLRSSILVLVTLLLPAAATAKKPIVAVFGVENQGTGLTPQIVDRLTIYLASKLTESGAYEVVPQDKLKEALLTKKKDSYKQCYAQSCQIEVGQELAANRALSTQLLKVGTSCVVTLNLYDLRTATAARAATGRGGCDEDAIMASIDGAFAKLTAGAPPAPAPAPMAPGKPIAAATPPPSGPAPAPADAPPSPPVYKRWWFWTLIGVAVVGVTVGVVVAVTRKDETTVGATGGLTQPLLRF
jgi:hypothetical protein